MKPVYLFRVLLFVRTLIKRTVPLLIVVDLACLLGSPLSSYAEGTKQVMPNPTNGTGLIVSTTTTFPLGNVGSYLGSPVDNRIYIHIKDYNAETLYYGFNWETLSPSTPISTYSDVYMNIYNPSGTLVSTVHLPGATAPGFISSYTSAIQGPIINGAPTTGYNPLTFKPTVNGDYYVTFWRSTNGTTHISGGESMLAKYFDFTVAAGTVRYTGRVHCNEWAFSVYNPASNDIQDPLTSTNAQFYGYTPDEVTVKVSFPAAGGFQPLSYIVAFNDFGVINNGNWINDRRSIVLTNLVAPYLTGGFPVFLNPPDAAVYPTAAIPNPPVLLAPVIAGCPPGPYNVRFEAPQAGDYYMLFDLNGDSGYQAHTSDRFIELPSQSPGIITYVWDGKDGLGNIVPANTTFPIRFSYRQGRINIPFYDVELNVNGFRVDGISPAGAVTPNATLYWCDTLLTNTGSDCSSNNNNYTGTGYDNSIVGVTPTYAPATNLVGRAWDGNGNSSNKIPAPSIVYSGTANDKDNVQCNDYGNARLLNTWAWGITLNTSQNLTLTCVTVSGTVWDDADGSAKGDTTNIRTNSEVGVNAGGALYANLVDPVTGNVISSVAVASNGTFTLPNCPVNAVGMEVYITTSQGTAGSHVPAAAIPSAWINTSPLIRYFNSGTTPVTGEDFGIEQLPNSVDQNYTIGTPVQNSTLTLNGAGTVASPGPLAGSDPEDGVLGSGKTVVITSLPTNEQLYYNGTLLTAGYKITNYNPAYLAMKFTDIAVTSTSFTYAYVDAASEQDPTPATYTINFSIILATTLESFSGKSADQGNILTWTSYEDNSGITFTIQRSTDGVTFTSIGSVAGTGNGATVTHNFTDNSPTPNTPDYYRLEWTDNNGNIAFSNVIMLGAYAISAVTGVAPNPFHSSVTVHLSLPRAESVSIRLVDSKGLVLRLVQYQASKGDNSLVVDGLGSLPVSIYFLQIVLADQVYVKKIFN